MDIEKIFDTSDFESLSLKWGLRGDPYLWEELKKRALEHSIFQSKTEFEKFIDINFKGIVQTGELSKDKSRVLIDRFPKQGISGGWVSLRTWESSILPLLKKRYH